MAKILIVDDHPLFREGVITALRGRPIHATVAGVATEEEARREIQADPTYDLMVVDVRLADRDGLIALANLAALVPDIPRMAITGYDAASMGRQAMAAGAQGLLLKSMSIAEIVRAIRIVLDGGSYWPERRDSVSVPHATKVPPPSTTPVALTARQREALDLLCEGRSNSEIAFTLKISERTVKAHLQSVYQALQVDTRTRAVVKARALGLCTVVPGAAGLSVFEAARYERND